MWHGYYAGGWPMVAGGILFWGSIVFLVAWGIHRTTNRSGSLIHYGKRPLDYAKERYAKGEITRDQFDEIKRDLMR